jgi:1,4-dihydroxy-2-naphthoyl-CoA hydrolase
MTLDDVKTWASHRPTLADALGIELTALTEDYLEGRMPVDGRTHQPMGLLHGGASVALAETLGSIGAATRIDVTRQACVGLEINANHIKGVRDGWVRGRASALHVGAQHAGVGNPHYARRNGRAGVHQPHYDGGD